MSNISLSYLPGCCKSDSVYSNSIKAASVNGRQVTGRFTDMQWVRFIAGFPEKIIPFLQDVQTFALSPLGIRRLQDWRDNNANIYLAMGCDRTLQVLSGTAVGGTTVDITPLRFITTGTATNVLSMSSNSEFYTVAINNNNLALNDWVQLVGTAPVAGVTIANNYSVAGTGTSAFIADVKTASTTAGTSIGGVITYAFPKIQLTNPFITSTASNTSPRTIVTVTHTANGASAGDMVYWTGGTSVGGVNLTAGTTTINTATTNSYTIVVSGTATANGTGGGSPIFSYGITFQSLSQFQSPSMWTISPYGQQILCSVPGASVYVYDPSAGGRAYPLYGAPSSGVYAMFVTAERFVFVLGSLATAALNVLAVPNPSMTVIWPDQSNYNTWTALPTNTANSGRALQEGSYLVGGISVRDGISLVFTNTAVYQFQYSGDNNVYSSSLAGKACGLIGPAAVAVMSNIAYWFSGSDFWMWNGQVQKIPSDDIRDYVVSDLDKNSTFKCAVGTNIKRNEVWFLYPSATDAAGENTRYVIYHTDQQCFSIGKCDSSQNPPIHGFTAFTDKNLFESPLLSEYTSLNGNAFTSRMNDALSNSSSAFDRSSLTFSPMDISKGDKNIDLFAFLPDFQNIDQYASSGTINLSINTQSYPGDAITINGTNSIVTTSSAFPNAVFTNRIDLRLGAKLVGYKLFETSEGSALLWRLGVPRVEIQPAGARR